MAYAISLDELLEGIDERLSTINPKASSYDQGRAEELQWTRDQIDPPEEADDESDDESEPFAKPAAKATTAKK